MNEMPERIFIILIAMMVTFGVLELALHFSIVEKDSSKPRYTHHFIDGKVLKVYDNDSVTMEYKMSSDAGEKDKPWSSLDRP